MTIPPPYPHELKMISHHRIVIHLYSPSPWPINGYFCRQELNANQFGLYNGTSFRFIMENINIYLIVRLEKSGKRDTQQAKEIISSMRTEQNYYYSAMRDGPSQEDFSFVLSLRESRLCYVDSRAVCCCGIFVYLRTTIAIALLIL